MRREQCPICYHSILITEDGRFTEHKDLARGRECSGSGRSVDL